MGGGRKDTSECYLAEEDGLRRVCRVHHVLVHPAGPDEAPLVESSTCVGFCQPITTLNKKVTQMLLSS